MSDKEVSDFCIERKECPVCSAIWLNGQHRWYTGKVGNEKELSNLVCGLKNDIRCINPMHRTNDPTKKGGKYLYPEADTWEKRRKLIDDLSKEIDDV